MSNNLQAFHDAVQSLKLYRRAELPGQDNSPEIIESLYVDPLPNNYIFATVLKPNTTFIIGRKGTGKSTIFQRVQYELLSDKKKTSAYVDIKTVFESSKISSSLYEKITTSNFSLPQNEAEKILLFKSFIASIVEEIKSELKKRVKSSFLENIKEIFSGNLSELFEELDELIEQTNEDDFMSVLGVKSIDDKEQSERVNSAQQNAVSQGFFSKEKMGLEVNYSSQASSNIRKFNESNYTDILLKIFDVKDLLSKLKKILSTIGVRNLYILVDDFSELPEDAMRIVVDLLLAPLNNWSEEFIKLKIAAYPGRIYYGEIDKTKIDEIYLDIYELYGSSDISSMEDTATEFVKRLVSTRLETYNAGEILSFFEIDSQEIWRNLFYATMANPRIIGYILSFCHESHLLYGRRIGAKSLQQASRRYYEQKVESYFGISKFLHESFGEKSSIYSLKELLELIVTRAKELRSHTSSLFNSIEGRPPTSHFHISVELESILTTLELNFFLTKYYEMSDRDGRKVAVYALNYGLCQKYTLSFGRPIGKREFRTYFVERVFDYTPIIQKYMFQNQEIVCSQCSYKYSINDLEAIKWNKMRYRECINGICEVINLSRKYEEDLRRIDQQLLLPSTELGILQTLHLGTNEMYAAEIASELDCSYQLVGKRGRFLDEKGLVKRGNNEAGRRVFSITELAEESYFSDQQSQTLDVNEAPHNEIDD